MTSTLYCLFAELAEERLLLQELENPQGEWIYKWVDEWMVGWMNRFIMGG
jgi:hypothetical protein